MANFFAVNNLAVITPLVGCETVEAAVDTIRVLFPTEFALLIDKEMLIALAANIEATLEADEIGGDPAHVAHLSPEELAEDQKMCAEMVKDVETYFSAANKEHGK